MLEFILFGLLAALIAASQPKPHHHKQGKFSIIVDKPFFFCVYCLCAANSNTLERRLSFSICIYS